MIYVCVRVLTIFNNLKSIFRYEDINIKISDQVWLSKITSEVKQVVDSIVLISRSCSKTHSDEIEPPTATNSRYHPP